MADDLDDGTGDGGEPAKEPSWAKKLRDDAEATKRENAELKTKLADRERADLFTKAGVPETGAGALFRKSYDGPLTEDDVRKQALEFDVIKTPQATPDAEREALTKIGSDLHGAPAERSHSGNLLAQATEEVNACDGSPEAISAILDRYNLAAPTQ